MSEFVDAIRDGVLDTAESGRAESSTAEALKELADLAQCATDNGLSVRETRQKALSTLQRKKEKGSIILRLPQIDLSLYLEIISVVLLCAFADCDTLIQVFKTYFADDENQLKNGISDEMTSYSNRRHRMLINAGSSEP